MLKAQREGETITVVSDDGNAENVALGEAIDLQAPHLLADYEATDTDGNGELHWTVRKEDWRSLIDVLEATEGVNPNELDEAIEIVAAAVKESGDE